MSNFGEFLLPLIRGMALARLLSPAEFGLSISITAVASTIELISDLGFAQMALRAGTPKTLGTLHALAIVRGAGLALMVAAAGPLFAFMFNAPGTAWIYTLVGLSSLLRSLSHLEPKIRMRDYSYTPEALTVMGGQIIWTIVSIGLAFVLRDYRAMVIGLLAYSAGSAIISHVCSSGRYTLAWNKETVSEAILFGRPLTLNGIALAITGLGDRFLTGSRIGLEQLAQYTAMATAALMPRSVVIRFALSLFVPQFVNASDEGEKRRLADVWIILLCSLGGLFGLCYIAVGQVVVAVAFGKHYLVDQRSIDLIAILACIRYMATIPVAPSMANGRTSFVLLNTTLAASGLVLAAVLLGFYPTLQVMVSAMIVGEGFGFLFVLNRLRHVVPLTSSVMANAVLVPLAMLIGISIVIAMVPSLDYGLRWSLCGVCILIEVGLTALLLRRSGSTFDSVRAVLLPRRPASASMSEEPVVS